MTPLIYRIRHKPTGLFYSPVRGRWSGDKTHLGPNGKLYIFKKPNFKDIGHNISVSDYQIEKYDIQAKQKSYDKRSTIEFIESDWEIITYKLEEIESE